MSIESTLSTESKIGILKYLKNSENLIGGLILKKYFNNLFSFGPNYIVGRTGSYHHTSDGRFQNLEEWRFKWTGNFYFFDLVGTVYNYLKWKLSRKKIRVPYGDENLKVEIPKFIKNTPGNDVNDKKDFNVHVTWIGHATFFIQFEKSNVNILTDPIFTNTTSTTFNLFNRFSPNRIGKIPARVKDLPRVDIVIISHSHNDHLSLESCLQIFHRFPKCVFYVPLKVKEWFLTKISKKCIVREMDWWEKSTWISDEKLQIWFLPSQHWSNRNLFDFNVSKYFFCVCSYFVFFSIMGKLVIRT